MDRRLPIPSRDSQQRPSIDTAPRVYHRDADECLYRAIKRRHRAGIAVDLMADDRPCGEIDRPVPLAVRTSQRQRPGFAGGLGVQHNVI
jgi:hypothetical protein